MLKILQQLLEAGKISEEAAKTIDEDLSAELKKLRDEAAEWRLKYKELNATYKEVVESKQKFENEYKSLEEKIAKAKEEGKKELVAQLEKEKAEKEELLNKLTTLETTAKEYRVREALLRELTKYDLLDSDIVFDVLTRKVDVLEGEVKFKDGTSLQEGIEKFFEEKPHLLKPKGSGGSGAGNQPSESAPKTLTELHLQQAKRQGII